jgi:hypothetical protein
MQAANKKEEWAAYRHTTDATPTGPTMQSVIEQNDLSELMNMVRPCHVLGHESPTDRHASPSVVQVPHRRGPAPHLHPILNQEVVKSINTYPLP